jgi:hypothetical protein
VKHKESEMKIAEKKDIPEIIEFLLGVGIIIATIIYFNWLVISFYIIVGLIITIAFKKKDDSIKFFKFLGIWPIALPVSYHTREDHNKEKNENIFSMVAKFHEEMSKDGTDEDEIPEGKGEFGLDVTNPIPVRGILANEIYLNRLLTENGEKITWERIGSFGSGNIDNPIDGYAIFDKARKQIATVYISPYHKKISSKAPRGFRFSDRTKIGIEGSNLDR